MGGVDEDDRLGRDETRQVLRRSARMALPFKRTIAGAFVFTFVSTLGLVLGPVLIGYGIDDGIAAGDRGVLRNAVVLYVVIVVIGYLAARQQFVLINRAGENFLRVLRTRVF
ncbi:MAG: hypothetical protein AAFY28_22715, partial [Actinomycetota bacterium]